MAEHLLCNEDVGGSIPSASSELSTMNKNVLDMHDVSVLTQLAQAQLFDKTKKYKILELVKGVEARLIGIAMIGDDLDMVSEEHKIAAFAINQWARNLGLKQK